MIRSRFARQFLHIAVCAVVLALSLVWAQAAQAQSFTIKGVKFDQSSYLSDAQLQAVAAKYTGRPIEFEDLQTFVTEVQQLYSRSGVLTARVLLPPQEISDGILKVSLVEARISDVLIEGYEDTNPEFLRRSINFEPGEKPDFVQLERDLLIYDIVHDISPKLTFGPGVEPGTTVATIHGAEPEKFQWTLSADNFGREETGIARVSLFGRWSNVTGWRDTLSMQIQGSEGARSGSLGYSRPVGLAGGRVITTAGWSNSSVIQGTFVPVNIVSDSISASLGYRIPLNVSPESHWIAEGGLAYDNTSSTLFGAPLSDITIGEIYATGSYTHNFPKALLALSFGLKAGNAEAQETTRTEGDYYLAFGGLSYSQLMGDSWLLDVTAQAQFAQGQNLPVARLFSAGGPVSVRGYPNNIRSGDSGLVAKFQVSPAKAWRPGENGTIPIRPFAFLDAALVVPYRINGGISSDQDYMASIGGGARIEFGNNASGLLMVGVPLIETLGFRDTGKATIMVGLDYKF